ncbi:MAG: methylmalonyl Co-A mutase-associated GTPase MeaB [Actinomycetota bacterium]|jgi:LAO/AO transport system kinase|nr:methylmalonyl Co-A mutase-associated GTPase MeaB [Actinomycetota bacterium]
MPDWVSVLDDAAAGSETALARTVTAVESGDWGAIGALGRRLVTSDRQASRVGLTGAAGAGKSTLLAALSRVWPGAGRVGGIAVDPSSEVSGGAVLGDRYRLYRDGRVGNDDTRLYLRSMAARGLGGAVSRHVGIVTSLLEAVGLDPIIVETAGAGQSDTSVKAWVDCLVLVLTPESGDIMQMLKAGLMEWADIFVVNKADRDGADRFASQLRGLVASQHGPHPLAPADRVQLLQADRADADDLAHLVAAVERVAAVNARPRRALWERVIGAYLKRALMDAFEDRLVGDTEWHDMVSRCARGEIVGSEAVDRFLPGTIEAAG